MWTDYLKLNNMNCTYFQIMTVLYWTWVRFQWLKRNKFLKTFGYKKNYDEIFLKIYKAMIQPVFSYCGTFGLCFLCSRISRIESNWTSKSESHCIGGNYQFQTVESLTKRQSCQLVFDCLHNNVCTPFKGYFTKLNTTLTLETMGVH